MKPKEIISRPSRREFGVSVALAAAATTLPSRLIAAEAVKPKHKFCAFVKFLQALDYDQLTEAIADAGFDGVEVTAREKEGYILPAAAADELPKLQEALAKRNLEITILTTDILSADQTNAGATLQAAADLKIPRYRLGFHRYDMKRPILNQITELQPAFRDLAAMNRELGIAGIYQNHCGADFVGATIWDLHELIKDYPVTELGCVFDFRHAAVEAGEAWPVYYNVMEPQVSAVSVKDYVWDGLKSQHTPLGKGRLDPKCFKLLNASNFSGPISVHVEYLPKAGVAENLQALKTDLQTLKKMLSA
ncbi:sugar phosphate isomerase/epimerase family protein [Bythopirellula polymerisocia]|uniref:Xylose isomerase-like TIM barrel n=1 Tax=Bythopirellula polymerisocia TaxID=2528003 RepID=A0A5C6CND8_9BACT|nr:sugar phosphate isomerase/epimerase family protein [Bythopirellula polymerisocia]TWU24566.1 Xylose isomerase-like TIM barrel [Bythopirellula polymerisocia]